MGVNFVGGVSDGRLKVQQYSPEQQEQWNCFVCSAKNGVFLFNRSYLECQARCFVDHSLMFIENNALVALLPANLDGHVLRCHCCLPFGGVISTVSMKTPLMLQIFQTLLAHCKEMDIQELIYKPVPYIYHSAPADEDLYALFSVDAQLVARNVSSAIYLPLQQRVNSNHEENRSGIEVRETMDFDSFMRLKRESLAVHPVPTADELKMLSRCFPDNVKLYAAFKDDVMYAGVVVYESRNVAQIQHAASSTEGLNLNAEGILEDRLINTRYHGKRYFAFGFADGHLGAAHDLGLITCKERLGARTVVYDTYKITV
jgi:hypothetical protein